MKTETENLGDSDHKRPIKLTKELLDQYREHLMNRGCKKQTITMYLYSLNRLYQFLQGEKQLTEKNLRQWVRSLRAQGYSDRTMNFYISSVNGLLRFCGRDDMTGHLISVSGEAESSGLTREEYLRLLACIKETGSERDYLIIRTLADVDIHLSELSAVTAQACRKGLAETENHRKIVIPDSLRMELLAYLEKQGRTTGPVFLSRQGNQMDRSNITHMIRQMGEKAGLEPGKCNSRALHDLYRRTQEEITQRLMILRTHEYERLLNEEKKRVS